VSVRTEESVVDTNFAYPLVLPEGESIGSLNTYIFRLCKDHGFGTMLGKKHCIGKDNCMEVHLFQCRRGRMFRKVSHEHRNFTNVTCNFTNVSQLYKCYW
jgi:hypothetical protein